VPVREPDLRRGSRRRRRDPAAPPGLAAHLSPATAVHGRPSQQLTGLALIHGYTTAFWWSAAILAFGAIVAVTLFRNGPLTQPAGPADATGTSTAADQDPAHRTALP
jgi:hypothetical protein